MNNSSKLEPIYWGLFITITIIAIVAFISLATFLRIIFTYETKIVIFGIIWLIISLGNMIGWLMTKSLLSFTLMMIASVLSLSYLSDYKGIFIIVSLIILFLFYFYFVSRTSKYNSNYRRILERAAKPVHEKGDGFTARPFPVGEANYSKAELVEFARFLRKNLIALPYFDKTGVKMVLNEASRFWFGRPDLRKDTYISFDFNGSIAVNIAKKEYQKYKDELTFDQLCASFGNVFLRFFEFYKKDEQGKIFEVLDR